MFPKLIAPWNPFLMELLLPGSDFGKCCLWQQEPLLVVEQLTGEGVGGTEASKLSSPRCALESKFGNCLLPTSR